MPAISKEQCLALMYGLYIPRFATANTATKFTGINGAALLASGVEARSSGTVASATNTLLFSDTSGMKVGDTVSRISGVSLTGDRTIVSINPNVSITISGATFGTGTGTMTVAIGGIDLANEAVPYSGNPARQTFTLARSETIGGLSVAQNGGDLNKNSTLDNYEKDYHFTGQCLRKKLK